MKEDTPSSSITLSPHALVRQKALTLFAEKGFQNITTRTLAESLGIQAGSLYNHMESKNELLFELIEIHAKNLLDGIEKSIPRHGNPQEKISAYIQSYLHFNIHNSQGLSLTQLELRNLNPKQESTIRKILATNTSILKDIIREGIHQKEFKRIPIKIGASIIQATLNEAAKSLNTETASKGSATLRIQRIILAALKA